MEVPPKTKNIRRPIILSHSEMCNHCGVRVAQVALPSLSMKPLYSCDECSPGAKYKMGWPIIYAYTVVELEPIKQK
jgi:hypothetical protein